MKGIYPVMVYILLFGISVLIFILAYSFTINFVNGKEIELEEIQTEKICNFLRSLEGKNVEVEIDLGNYRIEANPLRIIGSSTQYCNLNLTIQGSCSSLCKIKSLGNKIYFT
jgi:hypothetical protein